MINLLTPERQVEIFAEYRRRRRVVASFLALGGFAFALVLLGVLFFHLQMARGEVQTALERVAKRAKGEDAVALQEANRVLTIARQTARTPLLAWWETVLSAKPAGLSITDWQMTQGENGGPIQISIAGRASERQALLDFIDKLKQAEIFSAVDSPISNLIKNRDLDFNIGLILKSES